MMKRHPILSYFVLAFVTSWSAALAVVAGKLVHGEAVSKSAGILMFPAMLLGPVLSGLLMTRIVDGPGKIRSLFAGAIRGVAWTWYGVLLLPPATVLAVLLLLRTFVSPVFTPNRFLLGIAFGVPAGILEELGWTGFALPKMQARFGPLRGGLLLGILWSAWHLPVIDFLGAATPHKHFLVPFFLAFATAMTAIRVLIGWAYLNTRSLVLAQLIHISSTAALVIFSPAQVTPPQETFWYFVYGAALWTIFALIRRGLKSRVMPEPHGVPQIPARR